MTSHRMDAYTLALAAGAAVLLILLFVVKAHADTCPGCMDPAPEPPPVAGVACPAVAPAVDGCTDHVYMPLTAKGE